MPGRTTRSVAGLLKSFQWIVNAISKLAYKLYEAWLWSQISDGPFPKHVAIIPDGNRRWAQYAGKDYKYGHEVGYLKLKEVLNWLWELNVKAVTIYAMSYENCTKRSEEERNHLMGLLARAIQEMIEDNEIEKRELKVKFMGRLDLITPELRERIKEIEKLSAKYDKHYLNVALCYGGRQEIVEAVRRLVKDAKENGMVPEDVDEEFFNKYLFTSHLREDGIEEPDLVIRTSGELRISNFLLWQIAYSELYFCEAYWPEFRKIDLWRAIRSFQKRERRFGK